MKNKILKKILLKKINASSGATSILIGTMIVYMFSMFMLAETLYNKNAIVANYVEDGITSSLLGSALVSMEEYGASNQLIIYDMLDNHSYSEGNRYIDYIDGIELKDGTYYSSYIFNDINDIDTLGNIEAECEDSITGPLQSYDIFKQLIKTNMGLNELMIPVDNVYLPSTTNGIIPNEVEIAEFNVYNHFEFLVKGSDYDTNIEKPLVNRDGNLINSCDSSGNPLFEDYDDLVDNGLIHTKVVEFNIKNGEITDTINYDANSEVYITDSNNNIVLGEDGNSILVESSGLYAKLKLYVELGKEHITNGDGFYTLVTRDKTAFIDNK